jgi:hypothetical protein
MSFKKPLSKNGSHSGQIQGDDGLDHDKQLMLTTRHTQGQMIINATTPKAE